MKNRCGVGESRRWEWQMSVPRWRSAVFCAFSYFRHLGTQISLNGDQLYTSGLQTAPLWFRTSVSSKSAKIRSNSTINFRYFSLPFPFAQIYVKTKRRWCIRWCSHFTPSLHSRKPSVSTRRRSRYNNETRCRMTVWSWARARLPCSLAFRKVAQQLL